MEKSREDLLDLALRSRDLQRKLEHCTEYLESNPGDMDVWEFRSTILGYLGRNEESIECGCKAIELRDQDDHSFFLGELKLTFEDYSEAIEFFDDVLTRRPDCARAWLKKGLALWGLGRAKESLICLNESLKLRLSRVCQVEAWYAKGRSLEALGLFQEALRCYGNALDINPCDVMALGMKGSLLLRGEVAAYEEALECFSEALEILNLNPEHELAELARQAKEMTEQKLGETGKQIVRVVAQEQGNESARRGRPASQHCVKCHSSITLDALYCTECGTKQ